MPMPAPAATTLADVPRVESREPQHVTDPDGVRRCTDPACDHNGSGRGRETEPCSWCGYHDCDLDCTSPDED